MTIWNRLLFLLAIVFVGGASSPLRAEKPTPSLEDVAFLKTVYTFKSVDGLTFKPTSIGTMTQFRGQ